MGLNNQVFNQTCAAAFPGGCLSVVRGAANYKDAYFEINYVRVFSKYVRPSLWSVWYALIKITAVQLLEAHLRPVALRPCRAAHPPVHPSHLPLLYLFKLAWWVWFLGWQQRSRYSSDRIDQNFFRCWYHYTILLHISVFQYLLALAYFWIKRLPVSLCLYASKERRDKHAAVSSWLPFPDESRYLFGTISVQYLFKITNWCIQARCHVSQVK